MSTKATSKHPTKARGKLPAPEQSSAERDILDTLKKEHDEVKALLAELQDAKGTQARRSLVEQIKAALVPHTKAEEKAVYDAVIATSETEAETDGYEGYLEHELAAKTLSKLEGLDPATSEHRAAAKVLKDLVEHHIQGEEDRIWTDVREHFGDDERRLMNLEFEAEKKLVKPS